MKLLSLRPLQSASALLTMIAALFAIMLYLGWSTFSQLERQREAPSDSTQWILYQTSLEFHRLTNAYSVYLATDSPENLKELTKRFDIFYSRVRTLNTSRALASLRGEAFFAEGASLFTDFVERVAGLLDRGDIAGLRSDPAIRQDFEELKDRVAIFVTSAVQSQAARDEQIRSELKRLLLMQLLTSGLVIFAFAYFAIVVLQQRNSALRREVELRESRDLLRATVKSSLDSVLIADADGNIVDLNDATAAMFGFDAADMTGREMSGLIMPERLRSAHKEGMARYAATGKAKVMGRRIEIDALRKDGTEFPIELSISSTGSGGKARYVAFMRDITDRRMAEESLKAAKDRAEAASRAKAQFLAAISHEMRTPLTSILGALDIIAETELTEQQLKYVRTANRSGHALLSVISDVLDISRLEVGKIDLEIVPLDLERIIEDVVEIVGGLARERGNSLSVHMDARLARRLTGDPARIRQVLLNFATNAVKFTYGGSVRISAEELGRSKDRVDVEIAVEDTGPGISESDQQKLFQNFSQLYNGHAMGGSGLGLAISKRLVDLMSGSIGVVTELGKGSRFWFRLSLGSAAETGLVESGPSASGEHIPKDPPRRILVVDDNETVRSIVAGQLESRGHRADTAENAVLAFEMMKSEGYDAVILDISMPVMDGFEALRIMKGLPGAAGRTPVIALTAHALVEVRERCVAAGFDQFLTKPVRVDELAEVIATVTSPEAAAQRSAPAPATPPGSPLFEIGNLKDQFASIAPADLRRIIDRFGAELDQQLSLLSGEGSDISPHHLRRIVHVLAGSSSMIGAQRLGALAGHLDLLASQHEDAQLTGSVDELIKTIRETRAAVEEARRELETAGA
jgi:PAS domain S-box-containing protein